MNTLTNFTLLILLSISPIVLFLQLSHVLLEESEMNGSHLTGYLPAVTYCLTDCRDKNWQDADNHSKGTLSDVFKSKN